MEGLARQKMELALNKQVNVELHSLPVIPTRYFCQTGNWAPVGSLLSPQGLAAGCGEWRTETA
ncbi:hypothetical protein [Desulfobacca acetoxidans]|nr:hypothetical protein [Desulfobacterales bacterium]